MLFRKEWKFKKTGSDGKCRLFGVNIFDCDWKSTGETITVSDPLYNQEHVFNVYTSEIRGKTKKFAAGEFSNCFWGFYVEKTRLF